jgi:hypothetical protein
MRTIKNTAFSILKPAAGLLAIVLSVTACTKNNDNVITPGVANLALIHAAPGSPELSFKVNGTKNNVKGLTYGVFINYAGINEGNYTLSVTKKDSARVLATSPSTFQKGKFIHYLSMTFPVKPA